MEMIKLLEDHPKTATVIKQWLLERMLESMKDDSVPEEFKQLAREQGIDSERVAGILKGSPRALFDVFDSHKLYIQISGDQHGWSWEVDGSVENAVCSSRKEADTAAIVEAFKLLEAKL
jgi:hypothetical protein